MTCFECDPAFGGNLWHCHEASLLHADGRTECLAAGRCELPHELHHWQLTCADLEPPCRCLATVTGSDQADQADPVAPTARPGPARHAIAA